ncbi:MAG: energy transducer TonB, partial [Hyphomicrobium sp.]|nr:energy transducer TonB [Hyphomicrobium sp.]
MLRFVTIILSLGLHAALFLPLMSFGGGAALEAGTGDDQVVVEQGIALEGFTKFGEAEEMIETIDIPPIQAAEVPQPVEEVKPELTDVVTSTEGKHEEQVMSEEPKPVEEEERPQEVA